MSSVHPIEFTVFGEPQGKARPRFTRLGRAYTPKKTADYEKHIQEVFMDCYPRWSKPLETDLKITVIALFEPAKSYSKRLIEDCLEGLIRPHKKPDADNIAKVVLDALNGLVYEDDKQVTMLKVKKRYDTVARIEIMIQDDVE